MKSTSEPSNGKMICSFSLAGVNEELPVVLYFTLSRRTDALSEPPDGIIREKALLIYQKEVPYAIEAVVEEYKEERDIIRVRATILVERESQKGIVIGHKGAALKKLGTLARKELERFLEKKVFLQLHVKVEKDWRNRDNMLKAFGYKLD